MSIPYNHLEKTIDEQALEANYRLLRRRGGRDAMAVIKSEGYGHGLIACARAFERAGAETMAVGSVEEGARLRDSGYGGRIIALLGPLGQADCELLRDREILPFVGHADQLETLDRAATPDRPLGVALKFDTGMSRLGFCPDHVGELAALLNRLHGITPVMLASHLAVADDPEEDERTEEQIGRFNTSKQALAELVPFRPHPMNRGREERLEATLANTAGLLLHERARQDITRPGIGLYGANPLAGTRREELGQGLVQAMSVSAPVLQVHGLGRGERVSYGGTFMAERDMQVAVVGVGYADGYSRGLSSRGQMLLNGVRVPILGRVCMQMCIVDVSHAGTVRAGDRAYLLGGGENGVHALELAAWWGTISYEVYCLLGLNPRAD